MSQDPVRPVCCAECPSGVGDRSMTPSWGIVCASARSSHPVPTCRLKHPSLVFPLADCSTGKISKILHVLAIRLPSFVPSVCERLQYGTPLLGIQRGKQIRPTFLYVQPWTHQAAPSTNLINSSRPHWTCRFAHGWSSLNHLNPT